MSLFLSKDEMYELTRRKRGQCQEDILKALNVPYRMHPDGFPLVLRQYLTGTDPEPRAATQVTRIQSLTNLATIRSSYIKPALNR